MLEYQHILKHFNCTFKFICLLFKHSSNILLQANLNALDVFYNFVFLWTKNNLFEHIFLWILKSKLENKKVCVCVFSLRVNVNAFKIRHIWKTDVNVFCVFFFSFESATIAFQIEWCVVCKKKKYDNKYDKIRNVVYKLVEVPQLVALFINWFTIKYME